MEQVLSPAYIRSIVRRRYIYFLAPIVVGSLATAAIVMSLPSVYSSQATILVETQQIPTELVPSTITALASERLQVIEQRIKARDSILELARKHNLAANKSDFSSSEILDQVRSRISIVQADLRVGGQTGKERVAMIFRVSYEDENPDRATSVANELVTSILQEDVKTRTALASETSRFLEREAQRLSKELVSLDALLTTFRAENSDVLPDRLPFNIAQLEKTERELIDVDRELLVIEDNKRFLAFEQSIRAASPNGGPVPGSLADLEQRINILKSETTALSGSYSDTHPEMRARRKALQALEVQKAELEKSINEALAGSGNETSENLQVEERITAEKIKSLDGRAAFLKKQKDALAKAADNIRSMIKATPEVGTKLGDLERRHAGFRKSLDDIGEKLAQARLAERLEQDQYAERFEVIEQPVRPQSPSSPNRPQLLAIGIALSALLGGALAYGLEFIDDTIRTSKGFEGKTGLRPLAIIPRIVNSVERRRRRLRIAGILALIVLSVVAAGLLFHNFVRPVDQMYYRILQSF